MVSFSLEEKLKGKLTQRNLTEMSLANVPSQDGSYGLCVEKRKITVFFPKLSEFIHGWSELSISYRILSNAIPFNHFLSIFISTNNNNI